MTVETTHSINASFTCNGCGKVEKLDNLNQMQVGKVLPVGWVSLHVSKDRMNLTVDACPACVNIKTIQDLTRGLV